MPRRVLANLPRLPSFCKEKGMGMLMGPKAISCVFNEAWTRARMLFNNNRDDIGLHVSTYDFPVRQLERILETLQTMIDKYRSSDWAILWLYILLDLVDAFTVYHNSVYINGIRREKRNGSLSMKTST